MDQERALTKSSSRAVSRSSTINLALFSLLSSCTGMGGEQRPAAALDFSHLERTRAVLTGALEREGQSNLIPSIRDWPIADRASRLVCNCLNVEERSALIEIALGASQVSYGEALTDFILAEHRSREEVLATIEKFGLDTLWKRATPGCGREILMKTVLLDECGAQCRRLPAVELTSSADDARSFLDAAERMLLSLYALPEKMGRGSGTRAAHRIKNMAAFNVTYLRVQRDLIGSVTGIDTSSALVALANLLQTKLHTEIKFGLLFSHTVQRTELPLWGRLKIPGSLPEKLLDIDDQQVSLNGAPIDTKRTWRRAEIERMRAVLEESCQYVFPQSTIQYASTLWLVTRAGASERVLGLWGGGVVRIFDGATRIRISPHLPEGVPVSELGTIFLHEVIHAVAGEAQPSFSEFISTGAWREYSASRVELSYPGEHRALLDSGRWIAMGHQVEEGREKFFSYVPQRSDETSDRRRVIVYESTYRPPIPPGFFHELGPSHLPVYCLLEVYRQKGELSTLPEPFRDIVRTWVQRVPPSAK